MTHEDIEKEIAAGQIAVITLDTSAFGNPSEMSLEHGLLRRLEQFKGGLVSLMLTDVVAREVTAHMEKGAAVAEANLKEALKMIGNSWNIPRDKRDDARKALLGEETPRELAQRRFELFVERTGCSIIAVTEYAKMEELVQRYFSHAAPFAEKETKKYEFPDALALLALEAWAKEVGTKIIVVSNDDDWSRYCAESEQLVIVQKLGDALSLFHKGGSVVACFILSKRLQSGEFPELEKEIDRAIERHVDGIHFSPDAYTGFNLHLQDEWTDVSITRCSIGHNLEELTPLERGDGYLVAELPVSAELALTSEFSFSARDWVDKDHIPMGSTSISTTKTIEVTAIVTFGGDIPHAPTIEEVEIEGSSRHDVFFGEIEPDWMSEPPDPEE